MRGASFKIGLSALCAFLLAAPAHAQKTKAELSAEVSTTFPDNTVGQITPARMRAFQNDLINSIMPTAPVVSGNLACFNGTTGLLQDCGVAPNSITIGVTTISGGTSSRVLYNNSGKVGEYAITGTGDVVMSSGATIASPTITSPVISSIVNSGTLTLPTSTDTLVGRATTDTLTNKTLTSPVFTVGSPTTAATMGFNAAGGPPNYGDGSANHALAALDTNQTFSGNNTFSGRGIFTGTSAPSSAAGNTVMLGTLASPPTLSNNGQGFHFNTASGGAVVQGAGSVYDVILMNKSGTAVAAVATGTTTFELAGGLKLSALGAGSCVNGGLSLDGSNNTVKTGCPSILIAGGTAALGTSAISSAACGSVVTVSATGVATTDVVTASFNGDPTAVTGYIPSTAGMLTIFAYPSANNVNFKVCNNTLASVTPGAVTLNWRVVR